MNFNGSYHFEERIKDIWEFLNNPEVLNNLGLTLALQGKNGKAIQSYKEAIRIQPNYYESYFNMGDALINQKKFTEALVVYEKVLKFNFDNSRAQYNFAIIQDKLGMHKKALASYEEAIRLNPDYAEAYNNMGNIYRSQENLDKALDAFKKAIKLRPKFAEAYFNLGHIYRKMGQIEDAILSFSKATQLKDNFFDSVFNLGIMHLKSSEWVEGWRGFESRWKVATIAFKPLISSKPLWEGGFVERLLIWSEQGVGDEVMFSSCFNELESYCDQLIVSCDKRLLSLFERSFNNSIRFVDKDVDVDESLYDAQAPAGTAFGFLRQEDQSFLDNKKPYLTSDSQMRNILRGRLNEIGPGAKIVGISWKTSALKDAVKRSLDLSELVKEIPNDFLLVNLQYGDVKEELAELQDSIGRSILQLDDVDNFKDLDGFSSLIKACDKVISIDNSTVHFAGALGVECHVLLPFSHISDWRWGLNGVPQSYCYDKTYLHWQEEPNNWSGCLRSLKSYLMGAE